MKVFTGNYLNCNDNRAISISKDKGESANFKGNSYLKLAPKESFFRKWRNNRGIISDKENNLFYMNEYYEEVLRPLDPNQVLLELSEFGKEVIMLCYEEADEFCHRYLASAWLEMKLGINIDEVMVMPNGELKIVESNESLKETFKNIIRDKEKTPGHFRR